MPLKGLASTTTLPLISRAAGESLAALLLGKSGPSFHVLLVEL